jgi:hypothetical protein
MGVDRLTDVSFVQWHWTYHLVEQNTERPPVDTFSVSMSRQQFRGKVFRCTTESFCQQCREVDVLFVVSSFDMFNLHNPKSHSAICPV